MVVSREKSYSILLPSGETIHGIKIKDLVIESLICSRCKQEKPVEEFFLNARGYSSRCKACFREEQPKRYEKQKTKEIEEPERAEKRKRRMRLRYLKKSQDPHYAEEQRARRRAKVEIGIISDRSSACKILKEHHELLKDDPDRLSCNFLKKIIGVDCEK